MICLEHGCVVTDPNDAIPEDVRPDGTLPTYGTCRKCRQYAGPARGIAGLTTLSAPERALYGREVRTR